ncbi:unnamed protein product [Linum trigynum]|uniref:TF-B3 domain-containing protein n=1 Tax=Linum trigynum TaxID=586398 RepID=A0AAV2EJ61_9ROSI
MGKEEQDQEPLLNLEDLKGKIDFTSAKHWTPLDYLRNIASIALSKLLRQEARQKEGTDHHDLVTSKNRKTLSGTGISDEIGGDDRIFVERKTSRRKVDDGYFVSGNTRLLQQAGAVIPERFRLYVETELGGRETKLMIQKKLFASDVDPSKARLSIPHKKLLPGVLTEEEEDMLRGAHGDDDDDEKDTCSGTVVGMKVKLVDPSLKVWEVTLKRWNMPKKGSGVVNYIYVLSSAWNDVVKANGLLEGEVVRLWGFRMGGGDPGRLGLALVRVDQLER